MATYEPQALRLTLEATELHETGVNSMQDDTETTERKSDKNFVMNRYIYHYSAQHNEGYGKVVYIDGIAQLENRITCHADYMKLKPLIAPDSHEKLTITSLSFIGMEYGS